MCTIVANKTTELLNRRLTSSKRKMLDSLVKNVLDNCEVVKTIGFCGRIGSGKTTSIGCINFLFGNVTKIHEINCADSLKQATGILFSLDNEQLYGKHKETLIKDINVTPRYILQEVGSACRLIDTDVFAKNLVTKIERNRKEDPTAFNCVGDIRYPNEITYFSKIPNSMSIKLVRQSQNSSTHESETNVDLCQTTHTIDNNYKLIQFLLMEILNHIILTENSHKNALMEFIFTTFFEN